MSPHSISADAPKDIKLPPCTKIRDNLIVVEEYAAEGPGK